MGRGPTWVALAIVGLVVIAALGAPALAPYSPTEMHDDLLAAPDLRYPLGTDDLGRAVLSRVIHGASVSVLVGVISMGTAACVGVPLGLLSGYRGGLVDTMIMRVLDGLMAFPAILLAIAIMAVLGPSLQNAMLAIGVIYIPPLARIVMRHVLPNCLSPIIVQASLGMGYAILVEAALSFLGLGVQPPQASWGSMLAEGRGFLDRAPWFATFPGLAIFVTVLGLNLVGDRLRETLDPRLRTL